MLIIFFTTVHKNRLAFGSTPAVGSSSRMTSGDPVNDIAVDNFLLFPPEYSPAGIFLNSDYITESGKYTDTCIELNSIH